MCASSQSASVTAENDGTGLAEEHPGTIHEAHRQRTQRWHPILRQLQNERRLARFEDRTLQQPRRCHRGNKSGEIQPEHHDVLQTEKSVQECFVRNERRNQQHVDRQTRRAGHEGRHENRREAVALVLDGARRHDGRNCAGICREQGDERLPFSPVVRITRSAINAARAR